jgi:hypothetical protein
MKLKDLAIILNITFNDLVKYYKNISIDIPEDENFDLDYKTAKRAKFNLTLEEFDRFNTNKIIENPYNEADNEVFKLPETEEEFLGIQQNNETEKKDVVHSNQFNSENTPKKYFKKTDEQLITEILSHNQIDNLLLNGTYKQIDGQNFGFFENIKHESGKPIYYPVLNKLIDTIFIPTSELENRKRYIFDVEIARKSTRKEKNNPFLIQAKISNINEIVELSALLIKIKEKKQELEGLEYEFANSQDIYNQQMSEIENTIEVQKNSKLQEANKLIEDFNEHLISLEENINTEISRLYELTMQETLSNLNQKRSEMENTILFLQNKIGICKKLEFLTDEDANKYLNILSSEFQFQNSDFLDFETDLDSSFYHLATHIQHYLYHKKNLIYTDFQIRNFLTLLLTNDLIVLSGLSGSGKTQIVKSFAEALGGVAKIIPVKPNWTSSDDLLGYFNPIQSSYLPTPFTEAIVEAILNPHQVYLICLDEMNLARVEYYFADFLSGLEERTKQPEIDLYAKHEEELFISEFKTLLSLVESSIGTTKINSWNEFLENDTIRKRFFDILGNLEQDTMFQIHSKMKKRLVNILKFPSSLKIPNNVRFIGAINVDETTHYFSPKILDRVHIVKFENPLLIEDTVNNHMENSNYDKELKPVYFNPVHLGVRQELPSISNSDYTEIVTILKEINKNYLLPLSIDFGVRSIRQAINYTKQYMKIANNDTKGYAEDDFHINNFHANSFYVNKIIALNAIIMQKILPRFMFDGNEKTKQDEKKIDVLIKFQSFLQENLSAIWNYDLSEYETGNVSVDYLNEMIKSSNNNSQINFFN